MMEFYTKMLSILIRNAVKSLGAGIWAKPISKDPTLITLIANSYPGQQIRYIPETRLQWLKIVYHTNEDQATKKDLEMEWKLYLNTPSSLASLPARYYPYPTKRPLDLCGLAIGFCEFSACYESYQDMNLLYLKKKVDSATKQMLAEGRDRGQESSKKERPLPWHVTVFEPFSHRVLRRENPPKAYEWDYTSIWR